MKKITLKLSLLSIVLILSSCSSDDNDQITGSGNIISEERILDSFDEVLSTSSINVSIAHGVAQNIFVNADDNIINRINTSVTNNVLTVDLIQGNYNDISASVTVMIPFISQVKNTGSGNISFNEFLDLDSISFINSGSGSITLNGSSTNMSINNTGSGSFRGFEFVTANCTVNNSGSGSSELFCNETLTGVLSGSGSILYKGMPTITIDDTGSGSLIDSN